MKKILLFAAVLSAFTFASCKKERTCSCTTTTTSSSTIVTDWETDPTTTTTTSNTDSGADVFIINDAKKKDAKKACIDYSTKTENVDVQNDSTLDWSTWEYQSYTRTTTTTSTSDGKCSLK